MRLGTVQIRDGPASRAAGAGAARRDRRNVRASRRDPRPRRRRARALAAVGVDLRGPGRRVTIRPTTARALAPVLHQPAPRSKPNCATSRQFRWLARKVPHEMAERVQTLHLAGIETTRGEETGLPLRRIRPAGIDGARLHRHRRERTRRPRVLVRRLLRGRPGTRRGSSPTNSARAIPFGDTQVSSVPCPARRS
jgi:hypothetical protein